jgi:hypothetical protein
VIGVVNPLPFMLFVRRTLHPRVVLGQSPIRRRRSLPRCRVMPATTVKMAASHRHGKIRRKRAEPVIRRRSGRHRRLRRPLCGVASPSKNAAGAKPIAIAGWSQIFAALTGAIRAIRAVHIGRDTLIVDNVLHSRSSAARSRTSSTIG